MDIALNERATIAAASSSGGGVGTYLKSWFARATTTSAPQEEKEPLVYGDMPNLPEELTRRPS